MTKKTSVKETFFDVNEVYTRLDQAIYDYNERLEKYGQNLSDEMAMTHRLAMDTIDEMLKTEPLPDSKKKFISKLDHAKKIGRISERVYRLIMEQVY